jgi:hypothetical protein
MSLQKYRKQSLNIFQYLCSCKNKTWWGIKDNACKPCNKKLNPLPLKEMTGIGWFQCACGRRYAGFCQGNVTSKCHGCHKENLAMFIVPGDKADKDKKSKNKNTHYCAACQGSDHCPIVDKVKGRGNFKSFF